MASLLYRTAQVNALFADGLSRRAAIVAALEAAGLGPDRVTVIERPDPEHHSARPAPPAAFRWPWSAAPAAPARPPYDLAILVHLGEDEAAAEAAEGVLRAAKATVVERYRAGVVTNGTFAH